jgi:transposase-like protein
MDTLKTLQEAILYFSNVDNCIAYLSAKRWKDGIVRCPNCDSKEVKFMSTRRVWQCKNRHPKSQFSIKVGTIYEDSAIGLDKWLTATWMVVNCKNGVSSYEIHRTIGVSQKTAWFMLHRIRLTMQDQDNTKLSGQVEMDETFVGGKVKNMHHARRPKGTGFSGKPVGGLAKTIVVGMVERGGRVKASVVADRTLPVLSGIAMRNIASGSTLITDEWVGYNGTDLQHEIINHAVEYVNGRIHTNGIENFWSLLKRGLNGTYVKVQPFHLFRYIDEQAFRYNNRATPKNPLRDGDRFNMAVRNVHGRRLTYKQLTGKDA